MNETNKNSIALSFADLESHIGDAPLSKEAIKGHDSRVSLHIHSCRKRLTDPDGVSAKAAIDGLVKAKILKDDSAMFIKEISYSQEKTDEEKTIITIIGRIE